MPKIKIKEIKKRFILKKKWTIVTKKEITIKPKNISRKKFFLIVKLISLPYPDIDNDKRTIPAVKISIWKKIILAYMWEFLKSLIISSSTFEKFIFDFHP